jgi:hypothetical protein
MRSLSKERLQRFQLALLNRFTYAKRAFKEARQELEKERTALRLIAQVIKEREVGNLRQFPTAPAEETSVQRRRCRPACLFTPLRVMDTSARVASALAGPSIVNTSPWLNRTPEAWLNTPVAPPAQKVMLATCIPFLDNV